jgi:hypothetical protein
MKYLLQSLPVKQTEDMVPLPFQVSFCCSCTPKNDELKNAGHTPKGVVSQSEQKKPGDLKMSKNLGTIDASRSFLVLGYTMPKRKGGKPSGNVALLLVKSDSAAGQRSCCLWKEGRFLGLSGTARSIGTRQKESISTSPMVQISPADSQRSHVSQPHQLAGNCGKCGLVLFLCSRSRGKFQGRA